MPRLLCETCGYPLPGLAPEWCCAECGQPAADSDPARRDLPRWRHRPDPLAWIEIGARLLWRPSQFFRRLDLGGGNLTARLYLLSIACLVGAGWAVGEYAWIGRPFWLAWVMGMLAAKAVLALSYLEAGGVTFFSRQRGWRVPFKLAERVVCYAAFGWLPAAAGLMVANQAWHSGQLANLLRPWLPGSGVVPTTSVLPALIAALAGVLILGFEGWVYVGVRQLRYGNPPDATPAVDPIGEATHLDANTP